MVERAKATPQNNLAVRSEVNSESGRLIVANEHQGVNGPGSPTGENQNHPSGEGKSSVGSGDRTLEQVMKENERKAEELNALRDELASLKQELLEEKEDRLNELNNKRNLTQKEEQEVISLEEQLAAIKRDPRSKPWAKYNEEISLKTSSAVVADFDAKLAERYVKRMAKQEGVPFEKFEREIVAAMRRVDPDAKLPVVIRAEEAYERILEDRAFQKREKELQEKERRYAEGDSRNAEPRSQNKAELLSGAFKSDKDMAALLAGVSAVQEEQMARR